MAAFGSLHGEKRMSGEKVYLRPITAADTAKIVTWRNKDFVRKNFIYQKPFTEEGHMTWLREQVEPGYVAQFMICVAAEDDGRQEAEGVEGKTCPQDRAEGKAHGADREIGSVYLRDIDKKKKTAEYGVFIGEREALGRGYGTEAARLMLAYGFETLRLKKIFLRFVEGNTKARKSYEKAGFRLIENRRETVFLQQGKREVLFMEIERGSWESGKRQEI